MEKTDKRQVLISAFVDWYFEEFGDNIILNSLNCKARYSIERARLNTSDMSVNFVIAGAENIKELENLLFDTQRIIKEERTKRKEK